MYSTVADGAPFVNPPAADLGAEGRDLYDWRKIVTRLGRIRRRMELTPPVSRYEQVARHLRRRIFDGEFPAGSTLPSGPRIAEESGVSQPVAQRALERLEAEGLVRMEPGRGTTVMPRYKYRAEVTVSWTAGRTVPRPAFSAAMAALRKSDDPAVSGIEAGGMAGIAPPVLSAGMTAEAADPAQAVTLAWAVVRRALGGHDGWDLAGASVEARPAGGDED